MLDESDIDQDAFGTNVSCYRLPSGDGRGASIHPFSYMAQTVNPDLDAAIKRFMGSVDMDRIDALIDSVPAEAYGRPIMSEAVRASHKLLLRRRIDEGFVPLLARIVEREG